LNSAFFNLEKEKQNKILDAAFKEFADNGFYKANTDNIVKEAGISKGLLFYYFNNKKELYHDLIDIGTALLQDNYMVPASWAGDNYLDRYKHASMLKMKLYHEHPQILNFLGKIYLDGDESPISEESVKKLREIRQLVLSSFLSDPGDTPFRTDIPKESILKMIKWLMDGYEKDLLANFKNRQISNINADPYWDDYNIFLEQLKKIFYI